MDSEVSVVHQPDRHRYEVRNGRIVAGYIVYSTVEDHVVMEHTVIKAAYEGRGLGSVLASGALDDVRARGLSVVPQCPFVAGWIARNPEYADLVAEVPVPVPGERQ